MNTGENFSYKPPPITIYVGQFFAAEAFKCSKFIEGDRQRNALTAEFRKEEVFSVLSFLSNKGHLPQCNSSLSIKQDISA
jgi:hypothetical protein